MTHPLHPSLVVLGGINMDLVTVASQFPEAGETVIGSRFLTYGGGKGANQAVAAARMGARVAMVGRVGDDTFGPQLVHALAARGVDVSGIAVEPGLSSGIAVVNIDETAQNRIIQVHGANAVCGEAEAQRVEGLLEGASTLLLQLEVPVELSLRVAQSTAALGRTVVLDPAPARALPEEFYRCCSVITPNETEAQALVGFPVYDPASAARAAGQLLDRGVGAAVIKLGNQGVYYATPAGGEHIPPFPVTAVDSVAAGDAFNGAMAVALSHGATLSRAVTIGAAAGALAVTKFGAQDAMPHKDEVEALVQSRS